MGQKLMYHALIRTHHITSRKKITHLKSATKKQGTYTLLRTGGVPGVMYIAAQHESQVQTVVDTVQTLRYKDFELVAPAQPVQRLEGLEGSEGQGQKGREINGGVLDEVGTVKEMGSVMRGFGVYDWWRGAMGFTRA